MPEKTDYSTARRLKDLERQLTTIRRILLVGNVALLLLAINVLRLTLR